MKQLPISLDLCLRKTRSGKSRDYHVRLHLFILFILFVFERSRFQSVSVHTIQEFLWFEERFEKLHFGDRLVWTVGLTVKLKLRFQISQYNSSSHSNKGLISQQRRRP